MHFWNKLFGLLYRCIEIVKEQESIRNILLWIKKNQEFSRRSNRMYEGQFYYMGASLRTSQIIQENVKF